MNKLITAGDIVYFSDGPFRPFGSNLKVFINFLKITGENRPIRFSYNGPDTSLISDISVEENILLSLDNNMIDNKRLGFLKRYMSRASNPALKKLFHDLEQSCHLSMLPSHITDYTCRKVQLIKAILQPATYMIFDHRHIDLDAPTLALFQEAIHFEVNHQNKVAMLTDEKPYAWSDYATKTIELSFDKKLSYRLITPDRHLTLVPKKIAA